MTVLTPFFHLLKRISLALFSLKSLVLLSVLAILVWGDIRPQFLRQFDYQLVQWAQRLAPAQAVQSPIAHIQVDEADLEQFRLDPVASPLLPLMKEDKLIALILPRAVREQPLYAEQVLTERAESLHAEEWRSKSQLLQAFKRNLASGKLLVGVQEAGVPSIPEQAIPVTLPDVFSSWPAFVRPLNDWLKQRFGLVARSWPVDSRIQAAGYRAVGPAPEGTPQQLLWQQQSQMQSDLALELYLRSLYNTLGVAKDPRVLFKQGFGLEIGQNWLPMSNDGSVIPALLPGTKMETVSLQQALSRAPDQSVWVVGASEQQVEILANTFLGLQSSQYYYNPYWAQLAQAGMLVLLAVYLIWLQPKLRQSMALMLLAFLFAGLLVGQMAWQLSFKQILPLTQIAQWLLPASLLMMIWKYNNAQLLRLQSAHHNRSYELAQLCYQQSNLEQALTTLQDCATNEGVLSLLYDIAIQQERKRNYQQAANTYETILQRKPKYKDAAKRVEALRKVSEPSPVTADFSATHSLVMPSQEFSNPVLGRYEIQRELGRGSMGVVYLGVDPKISRKVAIKTLNYREFDSNQLERFKQRFFREAEAAGRLNHPNIVTVYDVGEEEDLAFIAMDFVEGVSLDRCVSESSLLSVQEVYEIVACVADALDYAHQQNIVHRDIKPANILYDKNNQQIKVADFGIARIVDDSKTHTGDMLGSPIYMSPEQLKGNKVDGISDIYSLGVTLYQLLTGALPYNGDSIANLTYLILNKKYKSVRELRPDLSTGIVRIVNKAMNKDPSKRYENAAAMANALRGLASREFGKKAG